MTDKVTPTEAELISHIDTLKVGAVPKYLMTVSIYIGAITEKDQLASFKLEDLLYSAIAARDERIRMADRIAELEREVKHYSDQAKHWQEYAQRRGN